MNNFFFRTAVREAPLWYARQQMTSQDGSAGKHVRPDRTDRRKPKHHGHTPR